MSSPCSRRSPSKARDNHSTSGRVFEAVLLSKSSPSLDAGTPGFTASQMKAVKPAASPMAQRECYCSCYFDAAVVGAAV
jgi:hypothetical protein